MSGAQGRAGAELLCFWRNLMAFCANCGGEIAAGANNCSKCGKPTGQSAGGGAAAAPAPAAAGGLQDNVAGMLAYITIIPAIVFLVVAPYNENKFIRFHSFQSIFFCVAWTVLWIALSIVGMIPFLGFLTLFIAPVLGLAGLALWIVLLAKAYGNQTWKLPIIGDLAAKQAGV
jgi:uncharacterized membrane protein